MGDVKSYCALFATIVYYNTISSIKQREFNILRDTDKRLGKTPVSSLWVDVRETFPGVEESILIDRFLGTVLTRVKYAERMAEG